MYIVQHAHLKAERHEGELSLAAADASLGIRGFEVRLQRLEPGAHGPERHYDAEVVVLVLAGCGKLLVDGGPQRFSAPCTVLVPARCCVQFVNHGSETLQMVAVRAAGPLPNGPST